jgi:hypothetical protein
VCPRVYCSFSPSSRFKAWYPSIGMQQIAETPCDRHYDQDSLKFKFETRLLSFNLIVRTLLIDEIELHTTMFPFSAALTQATHRQFLSRAPSLPRLQRTEDVNCFVRHATSLPPFPSRSTSHQEELKVESDYKGVIKNYRAGKHGLEFQNKAVGIRHVDHVAPPILKS